jgi:hypothetical protein
MRYDSHHLAPTDRTLVELAKGSQSFTPIGLNRTLGGGPVAIAWDGTYLDVFVHAKKARPAQIYQVQLSGSTATVVNTISLNDAGNAARYSRPGKQFWIQGSTILMPKGAKNDIGEWAYPAGGKPKRVFADPNSAFWGITVSLAHH